MTAVTPIRQTPLQALRNIMEVCACYEDEKNVSAESARQQLPRIRALAAQVIAQLGEPHYAAVAMTASELQHAAGQAWTAATKGSEYAPGGFIDDRWARDSAAIICRTQVTHGIVEEL